MNGLDRLFHISKNLNSRKPDSQKPDISIILKHYGIFISYNLFNFRRFNSNTSEGISESSYFDLRTDL